ncbi:hypothetical protein O6H91_04G093100 [Diphasiastrum complanatum]|uniref:Uncharacterized protein n=1 Tax=Diphasiastrum complanatum TaxID=34168 RepID=A0ACC2DZK3_DIPCM|nr:hypothetical protein O6H91_04G093100 [Diphasiastrum complanatum]
MGLTPRECWRRVRKEMEESSHHQKASKFLVPSPAEHPAATHADIVRDPAQERLEPARFCTNEGVRAGVTAGAIAALTSAVPVLVGARVVPWAQRNLNYTAQALLISAATIATYFIVSEQRILECARSSSYAAIEADRAWKSSQPHV